MAQTDDFYCDSAFSGRLSIEVVRETESVLAFHHTKPSYPLHIVIVSKAHIPTLLDLTDTALIQDLELDISNYRIITNGGDFQDSRHLHFHLISNTGRT